MVTPRPITLFSNTLVTRKYLSAKLGCGAQATVTDQPQKPRLSEFGETIFQGPNYSVLILTIFRRSKYRIARSFAATHHPENTSED
jgi:hypothetical protein